LNRKLLCKYLINGRQWWAPEVNDPITKMTNGNEAEVKLIKKNGKWGKYGKTGLFGRK
jgi:hypothetical protein